MNREAPATVSGNIALSIHLHSRCRAWRVTTRCGKLSVCSWRMKKIVLSFFAIMECCLTSLLCTLRVKWTVSTGAHNVIGNAIRRWCRQRRKPKCATSTSAQGVGPICRELNYLHGRYFSSAGRTLKIGMYRISGSYPVIRPIFHYLVSGYPVSGLLLNYPVLSGRVSYWYPAGYRIVALLAVTSSSRNTPWLLLFLGRIMMMLPLIIHSYNFVNFHWNFMKLVLN